MLHVQTIKINIELSIEMMSELLPTAILLYGHLKRLCEESGTGSVEIPCIQLGYHLGGISQATVITAAASLEEAGLIKIKRGGHRKTSVYTVL